MQKFIIGYGWKTDLDVIEADDLRDAEKEATRLSMSLGLLDDDLADTTWAQPYTPDLAYELGLLPEPTQRDIWRSHAPWR